jgi:hypothetical protein
MSRLDIIHHERSDHDHNFQEHIMTTRRTFLSAAAMGTAAAFTPLFAQGQSASGAAAAGAGASGGRPLPTNEPSTSGHYRPPHRVGMGGVPIGNGFKPTTDAQAQGALEAAWAAGVRYYDTAPWYGLGLSERRFTFPAQPEARRLRALDEGRPDPEGERDPPPHHVEGIAPLPLRL